MTARGFTCRYATLTFGAINPWVETHGPFNNRYAVGEVDGETPATFRQLSATVMTAYLRT